MNKLLLQLLFTLFTSILFFACDDPCEDVICENGGTCIEGICDCPDQFIGSQCEIDLNQIQFYLDSGETPKELYNDGVPVEYLYGKNYLGGLIFYFDSLDGSGLVINMTVLSEYAMWGCLGTDIIGLDNVAWESWIIPEGPGAEVGDGYTNTMRILDETFGCDEEGIPAKLCRQLGEDWFLPSVNELHQVYLNLILNGHVEIIGRHWSSTEANEDGAWVHAVSGDFRASFIKSTPKLVRAVRAF